MIIGNSDRIEDHRRALRVYQVFSYSCAEGTNCDALGRVVLGNRCNIRAISGRRISTDTLSNNLLSLSGEAGAGLLHRAAFARRMSAAATHRGGACAVYVDLDQIHAINELSGMEVGDLVILEIACLLGRLLPAGAIATHLSGDRYLAVLFGQTLEQASHWADRVCRAIAQLRLADLRVQITASLGVAALLDCRDAQGALAAAETACRVAKDRGRNRVEHFESGDNTIVRRHAEVRAASVVVEALERDEYVLHGQPIVNLKNPNSPVCYEILLRLPNDVSVGEYLQAAERYQILERLDRWVVEHVSRALAPDAALLNHAGVTFAVNVTGQALSQPSFADFVRSQMREQGLPPGLLDFEFTETAAVRNLNAAHRFIRQIADTGARVALDDFGTGLSSLALLKNLPVQGIKIDGSFVRDILMNPRSQALVTALVQIARQLRLETIAEFVECPVTAQHLKSIGVNLAQGYLYGRSRPLSLILAELRAAGARSAARAVLP